MRGWRSVRQAPMALTIAKMESTTSHRRRTIVKTSRAVSPLPFSSSRNSDDTKPAPSSDAELPLSAVMNTVSLVPLRVDRDDECRDAQRSSRKPEHELHRLSRKSSLLRHY